MRPTRPRLPLARRLSPGRADPPLAPHAADTKDDKKKDDDTKAVAESLYKDTDPLGVEHLDKARKDPLELAMRFVSRLEVVRPTDEETLELKADVMLRRGASRVLE